MDNAPMTDREKMVFWFGMMVMNFIWGIVLVVVNVSK